MLTIQNGPLFPWLLPRKAKERVSLSKAEILTSSADIDDVLDSMYPNVLKNVE